MPEFSLYSALTFQGGAAWRQVLLADLGRSRGVRAIIDPLADDELAALMTNLGGHDIEYLIETLRAADAAGDQPTCFIAYTDQGHGPALRRPQGQPCGADDEGADGGVPRRHGHPARP